MKNLKVGDIEFKLIKRRSRSITTKIRDGEVIVSAPFYVSQKEVLEVVEKQIPWIEKHLEKAGRKKSNARLKYIDGEKIYFLGGEYLLKIEASAKKKTVVEIDKERGEIIVQTSSQDAQVIKRAVDARFKKELMAKIDSLLPECQRITGKTINSYDIRKMTTSWGICHIKDRTVTFSLQLAQKSDEEIKYIIIHELTHLIEPNHSLKFKEHMTRFIPDWKRIKKEINS